MNFTEIAKARQSCRKYDKNRRVEEEKLQAILEAARLSPSACNSQPYHITVCRGEAARAVAAETTDIAFNINRFASDAPVLLVISEEDYSAKAALGAKLKHNDYRSIDIGILSAYITAEAALMTAMEMLDRTLRDTSVAVLGFGRIGKYLARLLHAMGATVTVCARREESLFEAAAEGCHPLLITGGTPMNGLHPLTRNHTVIFNTVPSPILDRELLLSLEENTLLIDLASAPFGVCDGDVREASTKNGLRYLRAPSLPGSYAPRDAGRIIAECILNELSQKEKTTTEKGGKQA